MHSSQFLPLLSISASLAFAQGDGIDYEKDANVTTGDVGSLEDLFSEPIGIGSGGMSMVGTAYSNSTASGMTEWSTGLTLLLAGPVTLDDSSDDMTTYATGLRFNTKEDFTPSEMAGTCVTVFTGGLRADVTEKAHQFKANGACGMLSEECRDALSAMNHERGSASTCPTTNDGSIPGPCQGDFAEGGTYSSWFINSEDTQGFFFVQTLAEQKKDSEEAKDQRQYAADKVWPIMFGSFATDENGDAAEFQFMGSSACIRFVTVDDDGSDKPSEDDSKDDNEDDNDGDRDSAAGSKMVHGLTLAAIVGAAMLMS